MRELDFRLTQHMGAMQGNQFRQGTFLFCSRLDWVILKVFSNLGDSISRCRDVFRPVEVVVTQPCGVTEQSGVLTAGPYGAAMALLCCDDALCVSDQTA